MTAGSKTARKDAHGVHAFRLEHNGERLFVVSLPVDRSHAVGLTRAELEIARALARGATNAQIAQLRGTSIRTVANQVASILRRLGAMSRSDAALKLALIELGLDRT
jgi:DNA-binding CsgD family transcriptional regulator